MRRREAPRADRRRSRHPVDQSRALAAVAGQQLLAIALMSALGVGLLTWYYAKRSRGRRRRSRPRRRRRRPRAQGEMALPPLGSHRRPPVQREPPARTAAGRSAGARAGARSRTAAACDRRDRCGADAGAAPARRRTPPEVPGRARVRAPPRRSCVCARVSASGGAAAGGSVPPGGIGGVSPAARRCARQASGSRTPQA